MVEGAVRKGKGIVRGVPTTQADRQMEDDKR
jgi:hypothetical protein